MNKRSKHQAKNRNAPITKISCIYKKKAPFPACASLIRDSSSFSLKLFGSTESPVVGHRCGYLKSQFCCLTWVATLDAVNLHGRSGRAKLLNSSLGINCHAMGNPPSFSI
jgi:hypothetical protein